ncbi:MAG: sulfurtransferase TusA family protein [Rhodospirillaceae bacterium]
MPQYPLNAKGLLCPLPVLRARKALKPLRVGDVLVVETTDAASPADFTAFCLATGHRLIASDQAGEVYRFEIEKSAG